MALWKISEKAYVAELCSARISSGYLCRSIEEKETNQQKRERIIMTRSIKIIVAVMALAIAGLIPKLAIGAGKWSTTSQNCHPLVTTPSTVTCSVNGPIIFCGPTTWTGTDTSGPGSCTHYTCTVLGGGGYSYCGPPNTYQCCDWTDSVLTCPMNNCTAYYATYSHHTHDACTIPTLY